MATGLYPDINDTAKNVLWFKIATNLYNRAVELGIPDLNPPSVGEEAFSLQKKAAYYAACLEQVLIP